MRRHDAYDGATEEKRNIEHSEHTQRRIGQQQYRRAGDREPGPLQR